MDLPRKGFLTAEFPQPVERVLYHAIPVLPQGDEIRTSINYGMEIKPDILAALGVTDDAHPPLVFAATKFSKALAFGLIAQDGEKSLNTAIPGTDSELVIVANRDATMSRVRSGKIFALPAAGFVKLPYAQNQAVSAAPVKFSAAKEVLEIKSAEDLMRAGLQIISFAENLQDLRRDPATIVAFGGNKDLFTGLAQLVKEGRAVWENQARNINPHPALAEKLGVVLPVKKQPAHKPR